MTDLPTITIMVDNLAQAGYLSDIARLAGYQVLKKEYSVNHPKTLFLFDFQPQSTMDKPENFIVLDDVLPSKFRAESLVKLLIKNNDSNQALPHFVELQDAILNTRDNLWLVSGRGEIKITQKETQLICFLKQRNEVVSRDELLSELWGYVAGLDTHTLETHIYRLRQKIEIDPSKPKYILTHGDGYKVNTD